MRRSGTSWNAPAILSWALRQTSCRLCCGRKSTNGAPSSRRWESKSIRLRRDRRSEAPPSISASERGDRLHHRNRGSECRNPDHACTIAIVWSRQRTADERVRKEGDRHRSRKASRFIEATADHCVCKQDEHEQHRAKRNRYVNPIDQVEMHPALLLPRVLQARHLLGNKTLDDPISVPDLIMYAVSGGDEAELARSRRKSGFDLLQRIFLHAAEHDKTHFLTEPVEAAEVIEDAVGSRRRFAAARCDKDRA